MAWLTAILVFCAFLSSVTTRGETRVNVTTPLGQIIGAEEIHVLPNGSQSTLNVFRGIPYALAPVGQFRFRKPRPVVQLFSQPLEALQFGPACPQRLAMGNISEDCLHLNIFAPKPSSEDTSFPVIVWVHGGAFLSGEGRQLPAETLASFGNIIVVTVNFRIGALGFLTTDDQEAKGNWGLWDQRLALQWVKGNIAYFQGDPETITLAGTTSGATCVTYHALYPPNSGLFLRIIAESGIASSPQGYHKSGLGFAEALAEEMGCGASDSDPNPSRTIVACLRQREAETIVSANVRAASPFVLVWNPVVDGEFIAKDPSTVLTWPLSEGKVSNSLGTVDALIGTTSSDGSILFSIWGVSMASAMNESAASGVSLGLFEKVLEAFGNSPPGGVGKAEDAPLVTLAVLQEYSRGWEHTVNEAEARGRQLVDIFTDKGFFIPNVIFARNHASQKTASTNSSSSSSSSSSRGGGGTFMYDFHQSSPVPDSLPWMNGSLHKDHDLYVFGVPAELLSGTVVDVSTAEGASDWRFSQRVMTYWSNFVKTGNPNMPKSVPVEWPPFTLDNEDYLHMQAEGIEAKRHCRAKKTSFWLKFVPELQSFAEKQRENCVIKLNGDTSSGHDSQSMMRPITVFAVGFFSALAVAVRG